MSISTGDSSVAELARITSADNVGIAFDIPARAQLKPVSNRASRSTPAPLEASAS